MRQKIKKGFYVRIGVLVFFVVSAVALLILVQKKMIPVRERNDYLSQSKIGSIQYNGKYYKHNQKLMHILFLGIDNEERLMDYNIPGEAGQSDTIILFSFNKETKESSVLQIPRDTMTEVDLYNGAGEKYDEDQMQIALQFAYSIGGEHSCHAAKKTISELLFDLPIDAYLALDIAAIPTINDALEGVIITFSSDYTDVNPLFQVGKTMIVTGEQAKQFVQFRDVEQDFSNRERMERQNIYLLALGNQLKEKINLDSGIFTEVYSSVQEYMITDMGEDEIEYLCRCKIGNPEIYTFPGKWKNGTRHDEFYADENELRELLLDKFYICQ